MLSLCAIFLERFVGSWRLYVCNMHIHMQIYLFWSERVFGHVRGAE